MESCEALTKSHQKCNNKAHYCLNLNGDVINYCSSHTKEFETKIKKYDYEYSPEKNKLTVNKVSRAKHDKLTGLPQRYTYGLNDEEKMQWKKEIANTKKLYDTRGIVRGRESVTTESPTRSKHTVDFERKYGYSITDLNRVKHDFPDTDVDKIMAKGRAAYASGSRATVTGSGAPNQWAYARLASVLTGGKSLEIDANLVGPKSLKKIFN